MTRKRVRKLIMSVTMDGYGYRANALMRLYRKRWPDISNKEMCKNILMKIFFCALEERDYETLKRITSRYDEMNW